MSYWLALNSAGLLVVSIVLFLVLRQVGYLLQRAAPIGARMTDDGPRIGELIALDIEEPSTMTERAKLLVFMAEHCSICKAVRHGAEELARQWRLDADIVLVYDSSAQEEGPLQTLSPGLHYKRDSALRHQLGIHSVPFGVVASAAGRVVSKGFVNEISHLESLLEAERAQRQAMRADSLSHQEVVEREHVTRLPQEVSRRSPAVTET
jgi:methylamine dehydrogenase accessory protein MauD